MSDQGEVLYLTGGTGFIGSALTQAWLSQSCHNRVIVQTRYPKQKSENSRLHQVRAISELKGQKIDVLVNLAGAPVADKRWTSGRKAVLESSRIDLTRQLAQGCAALAEPPRVVISASAIGYYGVSDETLDEKSPFGEGYAASLCQRWEAEALAFEGVSRLVVVRLGVVIGSGGVLAKLLPLYRACLGGEIGNGQQWFSWIHLRDVISALMALVSNESLSGVFNLTAPNPVIQADFARALGEAVRRPTFFKTPAFVLSLIFGDMARELLIGGQKVLPHALEKAGFSFCYSHLDAALENIDWKI